MSTQLYLPLPYCAYWLLYGLQVKFEGKGKLSRGTGLYTSFAVVEHSSRTALHWISDQFNLRSNIIDNQLQESGILLMCSSPFQQRESSLHSNYCFLRWRVSVSCVWKNFTQIKTVIMDGKDLNLREESCAECVWDGMQLSSWGQSALGSNMAGLITRVLN